MATASLEFLIILLLIFINGILAMTEIAVVSARKTRLQQQAEAGISGAQTALGLASQPGPLLSTVQIGITLIGILAGAFGGATFAGQLGEFFRGINFLEKYADTLGVAVIVIITTYLSLVIGELAPKQIGLAHPERIAAATAPAMVLISKAASPLVAFLGFSTNALLRLFGFRPSSEPEITEEEIKIILEQGAESGIIEPIEEEIVGQVFRLSDQKIGALMTPRIEVAWIDPDDSIDAIREILLTVPYDQFPVANRSLDNATGMVRAKDLLAQCLSGGSLDILAVQMPAIFLPEGLPVFIALEQFKEHQTQTALVIDEYGGIQGMVTTTDILEAIVGEFPDKSTAADPDVVQREDGSWLLDGMIGIDRFKDLFEIRALPDEEENLYQTLGGFVMNHLGRVPTEGDSFEWGGIILEVMDMDGYRVDKVLVRPANPGP